MAEINYMEVLPGGHCLTCHLDYEEKGFEHFDSHENNPTSCDRSYSGCAGSRFDLFGDKTCPTCQQSLKGRML